MGTMFADYRVPQILVFFDVLKYTDTLMDKLRTSLLLKNGEKTEVEIRGVSLWACELVRDKLISILNSDESTKKYSSEVNAILVDFYLWDTRRELADEMEH